ncbi:RES family NAD+ phosphorylase [Sinomonas humi]|uniref:RES domain-containing protein n=1 Tax=Sinomonas humi TaxID=1338436 RepID=A0A0B2ADQ6_9MICC|nr:RES family NAD+ phosphorylase [Sinomonas humi]KHL01739.1 hypothetical protein LK10_14765 [Sinomonas humi]
MSGRSGPALPAPPTDLEGFPEERLAAGADVCRAVGTGRGAWWFACTGEGRFDLRMPYGTCYLAYHPRVAVRERLGPVFAQGGIIPSNTMEEMELVYLKLPDPSTLADLCHEDAADFGAIRELASGSWDDYSLTNDWAEAFRGHGFDGVQYLARFSSGRGPDAVGLFGDAGAQDWPEEERVTGEAAFDLAGLIDRVAPIPHSSATRILPPPGSAAG